MHRISYIRQVQKLIRNGDGMKSSEILAWRVPYT